MNLTISVVIPTIQEERHIGAAIDSAWAAGADQVIVADGGSRDQTISMAEKRQAEIVEVSPGRGGQQNAGAALASGTVLVFQHADCRLGIQSLERLRTVLVQEPDVGFGGFHQQIDAPERAYRWIETGNALRVRWTGLTYGDQGIFIRRELFARVGGFPEVELMEDVMLMRRLRRVGRPRLVDGPIHVSARRWQRAGIAHQTIRNWMLLSSYLCGIPPHVLSRFYPRHEST